MKIGYHDIDPATNEPDTSTEAYNTNSGSGITTLTVYSGALSSLTMAATASAFLIASLAF